jgi:hypothetical protein
MTFVVARVYAFAGFSTNKYKYGCKAFRGLKEGSYAVYPVNPLCEKIFGEKRYQDIASTRAREKWSGFRSNRCFPYLFACESLRNSLMVSRASPMLSPITR